MGWLPFAAAALLAGVPAPATTNAQPASGPAPAATSAPVLAATPQFRRYNIDQGLPSSNVYTMVQDRRGMLWFGTVAGLARFDGTHFKVYRHRPGDPSSLASDDVSAVVVDSRGRVWAGGEGNGINLYVPASDSFRHFRHDPKRSDSLAGDDALTMAAGRDGSLWIGTYGHGLDHMTSLGHFQHLVHDPDDPNSLASNNVVTLYSHAGTVWIGTDRGLDIRRPDGKLVHVRFVGLPRSPLILSVNGNGHEVRASTAEGLFLVHAGTARQVMPGVLPRVPALSSVRDHRGNLWVATSNGLYLVRDGRVSYFPPRPLLPSSLPGRWIWDVMVDHEGGVWVATKSAGVAYLRPDWYRFSHYAHRPDDPGSLTVSRIDALASAGDGTLWVSGGPHQLDRLDPVTGSVTHYGKVLGAHRGHVIAMAPAGSDGMWLGFAHALGLYAHGQIHPVESPPRIDAFDRMVSTADGTLYVAPVGHGVYRVDRHTLAMHPIELAFTDPLDRQTSDLIMHDGRVWRASHAGLSRLATDGARFVPVPGVANGEVSAVAIAGADLWLVRPHGLERYRLTAHGATLVRRIDAAAGWPGMVAHAMLIDHRGRVWIFANAGLWRYDPATRKFKKFGKSNGLPSAEFTTKQLARLDGGTVFAGTVDGVVGFRPTAIRVHAYKPRLAIRSIVVRRDGRNVELPRTTTHLHLHWNDRDLRITTLGLSYVAPKRVHYRFFLAGLDTDWTDTGTRGTRELAGLPAGHYQLKVKAAGPSGAWTHLATPLTIDVDRPPWTRPWAWVAYALVILISGYLIILAWHRRSEQHHRVQMAEQHRQLAEQASAAKTRFLANLGHEIRTPMTGVLGMAELLLEESPSPRQRSYVEAIRHSGELLLKLVNDALDLARIEAGRLMLDPAPFDPRAMLADVRQLLQGQASGKDIELTAEADANVPAHVRGDALRIKQILLNLANNAIKFTTHGSVRLGAAWADGELVLHVVDTGPGISDNDRERLFQRFEQAASPERSSGSGLGLAICRELVALMGGRIALESTAGTGSHFTVSLPLPAVTAAPPPAAPAASRSVAARRVLLVEDDATVARVIQGLLEARGHHVTHAEHSLDALGELERGHFDILLLDLDLPGMDGYQLAGIIRERDDGRALPIVAITARSGGDEEQRARAAGMDAFARKPLTGEQLADLLDDLCPHAPANPS